MWLRHHLDNIKRAGWISPPDPIVQRLFVEPRMQAFLRDMGFIDYWREHGWPDGCRALEDDDFTCGAS